MPREKQVTISANATPAIRLKARQQALISGKSLREWAGEVIAQNINPKRKATK